MYLRRHIVRSGKARRVYLCIAHNQWLRRDNGKGQSRPTVYANLGREEDVDAELARELVSAIERCTRAPSASNSGLSDWMQGLNKVLRPIEPLLRDLVSRGGALARGLPAGPERESRIESVLRDCLVSAETAGNRLPVLAAKQLES